MKIFVTGLHRAGTHSIAKRYARIHGVSYIEESIIKWDSFDAAKMLTEGYWPKWTADGKLKKVRMSSLNKGFVLQCPGLAHFTPELSSLGKVYWCDRNTEHIVTSMINASIGNMAWHLIKGFKERFPDDKIWGELKYNGKKDFPAGFPKYYTLLIKVKRYFYENKFKNIAEKIQLEDSPIYDKKSTLTAVKPIKPKAHRLMKEVDLENESLRIY